MLELSWRRLQPEIKREDIDEQSGEEEEDEEEEDGEGEEEKN